VAIDLETYRREADEFLTGIETAEYRHGAGLTSDLPLAPLYERYGELFTEDAAKELVDAVATAPPGDRLRSRRALATFAVDGLVGRLTGADTEELARHESQAVISFDGSDVGYRESATLLVNEVDAGRRAVIERKRLSVVASELTPIHHEIWSTAHSAARDLGAGSYRDLYARLKGVDLDLLDSQGQTLLRATDDLFEGALDSQLRRLAGVSLDSARRSDLARFRRAAPFDDHFPANGLSEALDKTLMGLGIDLRRQSNIVVDSQPRAGKDPRAFCSPVRVPDEVYLVITPIGGVDDYLALFHEAGHAQHFGGMSRDLAVEARRLGDDAVTEAFAFLFEHLVENPVWLERTLGFSRNGDYMRLSATRRLLQYRRYAAKLRYEMELHGEGDLDGMGDRYAELLTDAVLVPWPADLYLEDVDRSFYAVNYIRAWALSESLAGHLTERFGRRWFESKNAGDLLRELWNEGQRWDADEMARELGLPPIDFSRLVEGVGEILG
jgi:hypothetical protein